MTEEITRFIHGECSESERAAVLARAERDAEFAKELRDAQDFDKFLKSRFDAVKNLSGSSIFASKKPGKPVLIYRFLKAAALPIAAVGVFGFAAYSFLMESKNALGYNPESEIRYVPMVVDISSFAEGVSYSASLETHKPIESTLEVKVDSELEFTPAFGSDAESLLADLSMPTSTGAICLNSLNANYSDKALPGAANTSSQDKFELALAEFERSLAWRREVASARKIALSSARKSEAKPLEKVSKDSLKLGETSNVLELDAGKLDLRSSVKAILTNSPKSQNFKRAEELLKSDFILNRNGETLKMLSELYSDPRNPARNSKLAQKYKKLSELSGK